VLVLFAHLLNLAPDSLLVSLTYSIYLSITQLTDHSSRGVNMARNSSAHYISAREAAMSERLRHDVIINWSAASNNYQQKSGEAIKRTSKHRGLCQRECASIWCI
jgi:hypothetical protein